MVYNNAVMDVEEDIPDGGGHQRWYTRNAPPVAAACPGILLVFPPH